MAAPLARIFALASAWLALALGVLAAGIGAARAADDPFVGFLDGEKAVAGPIWRVYASPYRGAGVRYDFLPAYLFEGEHVYLHAESAGFKFAPARGVRFDAFLRRRFEGYPGEHLPDVLVGMQRREVGIDAGVRLQLDAPGGDAWLEALHDVSGASGGSELRLGYERAWRRGRLRLRPQVALDLRGAHLDDYYYGVRPSESTLERPAYRAGAGLMPEIGVWADYRITERWRVAAAASLAVLPPSVGASPIVERRTLPELWLGAVYDVSPREANWPEGKPLIVRAYAGVSSDCDVLQIARLNCTSTQTVDNTGLVGVDFGRPLIERLNGWPVDLAAFLGILRHREAGLQPDFWQVNAYLKAYFYGFPWDARVRTRIGWGVGLSYAERIPFSEARDQAEHGRDITSKLLETFDPTVDLSLGDLIGARRLRETFVGLGVSHRSGIFGTSQLLGNVNGGSNFIYGYVETSF